MSILADKVSDSRRLLITIGVMSATLLQVLDTTIVNVALPHMQGSLGATPDQVTWVLTSYLVSSAIFMPLTGYFSETIGRKKYLLISIFGFVVASALCGAAMSLTQIVVFRLLQGAFGAALVPLSQAILTDIYPEEERGYAMAIWGIGVMVGPILGPTLGGYLTDIVSWRWNFYINIPFGILSMLLVWESMPDTPKKQRVMDWIGLVLISVGIGAFQFILDRGNTDDWFSARSICFAAVLMVIGVLGFIYYSLEKKSETVFDLKIFKDRNFALSSFLLCMFGLGLYGGMVVLPLMLENLMNYPVVTTGLVMAPRGISGMVGMLIVGKLINRVDPRALIISGTLLNVVGMWIGTHYNLDISPGWIVWPIILQGFGLGMIFVTLSNVAFSTLPVSMRTEGAGLYSLLRTLGSSVGISVVATIFTRQGQVAWNQLGGHIQPYNPALNHYLATMNLPLSSPQAVAQLGQELARQSQMVAFVDVYSFITWSFIIMLPLICMLRVKRNQAPQEVIISE